MKNKEDSVLIKAYEKVHGNRGKDYGLPNQDFDCTAAIWTAIFRRRGYLKEGAEIRGYDVPLCMVGLKMSREAHKHKSDNVEDGCGYFETLDVYLDEHEANK